MGAQCLVCVSGPDRKTSPNSIREETVGHACCTTDTCHPTCFIHQGNCRSCSNVWCHNLTLPTELPSWENRTVTLPCLPPHEVHHRRKREMCSMLGGHAPCLSLLALGLSQNVGHCIDSHARNMCTRARFSHRNTLICIVSCTMIAHPPCLPPNLAPTIPPLFLLVISDGTNDHGEPR